MREKQVIITPETLQRVFNIQQKVLVRVYRGGERDRWVPGRIIRRLGPVTYLVRVTGKVCKRHVNQLLATELEKSEEMEGRRYFSDSSVNL